MLPIHVSIHKIFLPLTFHVLLLHEEASEHGVESILHRLRERLQRLVLEFEVWKLQA